MLIGRFNARLYNKAQAQAQAFPQSRPRHVLNNLSTQSDTSDFYKGLNVAYVELFQRCETPQHE